MLRMFSDFMFSLSIDYENLTSLNINSVKKNALRIAVKLCLVTATVELLRHIIPTIT